MTHRLAGFAFGLAALTLVRPVLADIAALQPVQIAKTETVKFAPGGTIRLNATSGYLTIEGWDQPEVEISVTRSMGYDPGPAAEAVRGLDSVKVVTERHSDTELNISASRTRLHNRFTHSLGIGREATVEYYVRVPRNSHLIVNHEGGFVSVTGVSGNMEIANRRGDVVLMLSDLAGYRIDAHTKVGVVTSDISGTTRRNRLVGENFSEGVAALPHHLSVHMGFGGIAIKQRFAESLAPAESVPVAVR
jgi:hypothetical protein